MIATSFHHGSSYFGNQDYIIQDYEIDTLSYLSFEDALWDFLRHKITPGSTLLFPDFFCVDVWENCKNHGYLVETYPVNERFEASIRFLEERISQYSPSVVFIFHPFGIDQTPTLEYLASYYPGYIIEDCVHCILELNKLIFLSDKHIIIDSIRKLTPLPGSYIYAKKGTLDYTPQIQTVDTLRDKQLALNFWNEFQILLDTRDFSKAMLAYELLNSGDNLIGDSSLSITLNTNLELSRNDLNLPLIQAVRVEQVRLYEDYLADILTDTRFVLPRPYCELDILNLAFYPIILISDYAFLLKEYLLQNEIQTFVEFSDCPWAINKNVLCLPLGPHVQSYAIPLICRHVQNWFTDRNSLV